MLSKVRHKVRGCMFLLNGKMDPKAKCIHKYNHDRVCVCVCVCVHVCVHMCTYVCNMLSIVRQFETGSMYITLYQY
jgi:hypothetical protein